MKPKLKIFDSPNTEMKFSLFFDQLDVEIISTNAVYTGNSYYFYVIYKEIEK